MPRIDVSSDSVSTCTPPMRYHLASFRALLVLALALTLAACSGSRPGGTEPTEPPPVEPAEPSVVLADYEDFDADPYEDDPADTAPAVRHDVPTKLMDARGGSASSGEPRVVSGYRVQVFSTRDKEAADAQYDAALAWYRGLAEKPAAIGARLPAHIIFRQPLYRLRLGDFATRQQAESARTVIARRYPDAFIVPDRVTIR